VFPLSSEQNPGYFPGNQYDELQLLRNRPGETSYYLRTFLQELVSKCGYPVCSKMKQFDKFSRRSYRFGTSGPD